MKFHNLFYNICRLSQLLLFPFGTFSTSSNQEPLAEDKPSKTENIIEAVTTS